MFPKPKLSQQLYSHADMMPTVNGLLNLGNPLGYTFRGEDLSPAIKNPDTTAELQGAILFTFDDFRSGYGNNVDPMPTANRVRCIREKKWKYGYYFYIAPPEVEGPQSYPMEYEMYDLENDPTELDNLANPANARYNDTAIAAERVRLHAQLLALEEQKTGMVRVEAPPAP
jgi:arylsulfatase A-like enzyme